MVPLEPIGAQRATTTMIGRTSAGPLVLYDMPIEGRDEWLAAARRLA